MKRKVSMLLVLAMALCLLLAGCNTTAAQPTPPADDGADSYKIGFLVSDPSQGFWKEVLDSFQKACDENGHELAYIVVQDSAGMRSAYDSLVAQQCDIIVDGYAIEEVANSYAEEAVANGVPFMAVSFNCPVEGVYSYGTSNEGLGEFFGVCAADAVKAEWDGKIDLIVTGNAYTAVPAMAARTDKAVETLISTPGYEYLKDVEWVKLDCGTDFASLGSKTAAMLTSHPDAKNILYVVATDTLMPTIVTAVQDAGAEERVMMFSCDCTDTFKDFARETAAGGNTFGTWYGSIDLQTSTYGNKLLDKICSIMAGENPEAYTEHSGVMVTAANVNEYYPG